MSKIITVSDINQIKFYQLPKAFFHNPLYLEMQNESKLAYSILRDLLELSIKNNWVNENNEVYVKLSRKKMMKYLNIKGEQKIAKVMKELKTKELIVERQIGVNKCNEIYVCIPDELDVIYSDNELLESETVENTLNCENQRSRTVKIKGQELRKSKVKNCENQRHTKTNYTKTNKTNTNSNYYTGEKKLRFNNFEPREYDYDDLEEKLLNQTENKESSAEELLNQYKNRNKNNKR